MTNDRQGQPSGSPSTVKYRGVEFTIVDGVAPPKVILGVRKSGSSIMNSMLSAVAKFNKINYVDIAGKLFQAGSPVSTWQNDAALRDLIRNGNAYGGFRNAPTGLMGADALRNAQFVLLVRDPRDALVSEFFSNAYSHSVPASGGARSQLLSQREAALAANIDDYVLRIAPSLRQTLIEYTGFLRLQSLKLYRYEEAIMNKRWFVKDVANHFGWLINDAQIELIMGWADVMPTEEQPTNFIRKVTPGDHKSKLTAKTIDELNQLFRGELEALGYTR
jgi:hypothetical protein